MGKNDRISGVASRFPQPSKHAGPYAPPKSATRARRIDDSDSDAAENGYNKHRNPDGDSDGDGDDGDGDGDGDGDEDGDGDGENAVDDDGDDGEEEGEDGQDEQDEGHESTHIKSVKRKRTKASKGARKTRKRVRKDNLSRRMRRIYNASRILARVLHPFVQVRGVIDIKIEDLAGRILSGADKKWLPVYDKLVSHVPHIESMLANEDDVELDEAIQVMQDAMNQGKHADTSILRKLIEDILPLDPRQSISPRFNLHLKADRGFLHDATRALLIPQKDIGDVRNPAYWDDVQNGKIEIKAAHYPALMYDQDKASPADPEAGLFEGYLPIRVGRAILNGPRAVFEPRVVKGSNADIHNIKTMTGRLIAYFNAQTRFALSGSEKWDSMDGNFDMEVWYNDMVEYFEDDPDDPKAVSIIEHWNREVFGHPAGRRITKTRDTDGPDPTSSAAAVKAARLERRRAREALLPSTTD